jgi:voltage-gated potassium channel
MRPFYSYYTFADRYTQEENLHFFMEDIEQLTAREGSWTLTIMVASGANEPTYPTVFHYSAGGAMGDERFEGENLFVKDMAAYRAFYEDASAKMMEEFGLDSDHQRYHNCTNKNIYLRKFEEGKGCDNNIVLRIAWSACLWDSRRMAIAKSLADTINHHFESDIQKDLAPELKAKKSGY